MVTAPVSNVSLASVNLHAVQNRSTQVSTQRRQSSDSLELSSQAQRALLETQEHSSIDATSFTSLFSSFTSQQQEKMMDHVQHFSANTSQAASMTDSSETGVSYQLQAYINFIKQYSDDEEAIERILQGVDQYQHNQETQVSLEAWLQETAQVELHQSTQHAVENRANEEVQVVVSESGFVSVQYVEAVEQSDPLVLDLDNDGIELTTVQNGTQFAIDGSDVLRQSAFVTGGDAFLAMDRNGNGKIDDGKELFGDQNGDAHGFAALQNYDDNNDMIIDNQDSVYENLLLWADQNQDGISQQHELRTLQQEGISSISLEHESTHQQVNGNTLTHIGSYQRNDGTTGTVADALLNYLA